LALVNHANPAVMPNVAPATTAVTTGIHGQTTTKTAAADSTRRNTAAAAATALPRSSSESAGVLWK
jgi:hypothetical protein